MRFPKAKRWVAYANRTMTKAQRAIGETVQWYEFDKVTSTEDPVYDEGGQREWKAPRSVPVYSIIRTEARENPNDRGFYTVDNITLLGVLDQFRRAGISDPTNAEAHLLDRFVWDDYVWDVRYYRPRGRIRNYETTLVIEAVQLKSEEMIDDPQFAAWAS